MMRPLNGSVWVSFGQEWLCFWVLFGQHGMFLGHPGPPALVRQEEVAVGKALKAAYRQVRYEGVCRFLGVRLLHDPWGKGGGGICVYCLVCVAGGGGMLCGRTRRLSARH